jgi:hypothetical protein
MAERIVVPGADLSGGTLTFSIGIDQRQRPAGDAAEHDDRRRAHGADAQRQPSRFHETDDQGIEHVVFNAAPGTYRATSTP